MDYKGVVHFDDENRREELEGQDDCVLFCLPVVLIRQNHAADSGSRSEMDMYLTLEGLVLEEVDRARQGSRTYERIGYFPMWSKLDSLARQNALLHGLSNIPPSECMRRLGYGEAEDIAME